MCVLASLHRRRSVAKNSRGASESRCRRLAKSVATGCSRPPWRPPWGRVTAPPLEGSSAFAAARASEFGGGGGGAGLWPAAPQRKAVFYQIGAVFWYDRKVALTPPAQISTDNVRGTTAS